MILDLLQRRLLPALALLVAVGPLIFRGFPQGHDWSFELVRIAEYRAALAGGQLPPYWAENLYGGYGSPIFLFYAPAFLLVSALLSWIVSMPTAAVISLVGLACLAFWAAGRMLVAAGGGDVGADRGAARVAGYVYVLSPYLLGDALIRNANAEYAGLAAAPLALAALFRLRRPDRRTVVALALGLAAVILAHNLTALVVAGLLVLGAAGLYLPSPPRGCSVALAKGVALGLGLAAFFWIPALALGSWMRPEELLEGKFDFHVQFPRLVQLFGYERFFSLGALPPLIWLGGAFALLREWRRSPRVARILFGALLACAGFLLLSLRVSTPIWETLPFLPLFQFPWRMGGPLALMTALIAGLCFARLGVRLPSRARAAFELAVLALCIANAAPRILGYRPLPPPVRAQLGDALRPERIRAGTQSATVRDEYLPRTASRQVWRRERPSLGPLVSPLPEIHAVVEENRGTRIVLVVEAARATRIRLARWDFPGWRAEIDGQPARVLRSPTGAIELEVPEGRSRVSLRLTPPAVRRLASGLSLASAVLLALLIVVRPVHSRT